MLEERAAGPGSKLGGVREMRRKGDHVGKRGRPSR